MKDAVQPFKRLNNTAILDAIWKDASSDYQKRIPDVTKAGVQNTLKHLLDWKPAWNEFVPSLVNQIGKVVIRNKVWNNPLAKFNQGLLEMGDTVEEIMVGLIEAHVYNTDRDYLEGELFGQHTPDVQSSFHRINRQNYYPVTINENLLKRAFTSEYGLSDFVVGLMNSPTTSDQWDTYLLTTSLFAEYERNGGFFKVHVPDISAENSTEADAKFFLRRTREFAGNLTFLNTAYNAAGMPVFADPDELELFITPEALAAADVEALAGAFNIDKADMAGRITLIQKKDWNIPGAQAILTTRDFFQIYDTLLESTSQYNPVSLSTNYYLHHQGIVSASRFVPAVLFWTGPDTDLTINDTPVTDISALTFKDVDGNTVTALERGEFYYVDGAAVTAGDNTALRYELTGGPYSSHTRVAQTGVVLVSLDEPAANITVTAYAVDTDDPQLKKSVTATVEGDKLELWPSPRVVPDSDSDGLLEVTPDAVPAAPTSGTSKNKVKIPTVEGVDYKDGATVVNGQTITLTANKTITAVPQAGYEFTAGAVTSWNLTYTA